MLDRAGLPWTAQKATRQRRVALCFYCERKRLLVEIRSLSAARVSSALLSASGATLTGSRLSRATVTTGAAASAHLFDHGRRHFFQLCLIQHAIFVGIKRHGMLHESFSRGSTVRAALAGSTVTGAALTGATEAWSTTARTTLTASLSGATKARTTAARTALTASLSGTTKALITARSTLPTPLATASAAMDFVRCQFAITIGIQFLQGRRRCRHLLSRDLVISICVNGGDHGIATSVLFSHTGATLSWTAKTGAALSRAAEAASTAGNPALLWLRSSANGASSAWWLSDDRGRHQGGK